ncbi:MAG: TetR family transcriptional regulator C-terminal domain-containing protein, partial [Bacteroidota bacterium]
PQTPYFCAMLISEQIKQSYKELAVRFGSLPFSLKEIAIESKLDPDTVHEYFSNTLAIDMALWKEYFKGTLGAIQNSPEYLEYSSREKLLAFYFTFFEVLRPDRDFLMLYNNQLGIWNYNPEFMLPLKRSFLKFVKAVIHEGIENHEVEERYVLGGEYADWHWPQFLYLLNHWLKDKTADFTSTDKAVEKSVNLGFDIMGRNVIDSAFDFVKFVFAK